MADNTHASGKPADSDDEGSLATDQLDTVSGGIGSTTGGAGSGKIIFEDESPKEELGT
jgi:hypothetical protein